MKRISNEEILDAAAEVEPESEAESLEDEPPATEIQEIVIDGTEPEAAEPPEPLEIRENVTVSNTGQPVIPRVDGPSYIPTFSNQLDMVPPESPLSGLMNTLYQDFMQAYGEPPIIQRSNTIATERYSLQLQNPLLIEVSPGEITKYRISNRDGVLSSGKYGWTDDLNEVTQIARKKIRPA